MDWRSKAKNLFSDPAFGLSLAVLAGGLLIPAAWLEAHVPRVCLWHALGLKCWACGLTRSVCAAGHGQWSQSWAYHPLGMPFLFVAAATVAFRSFETFRRA